MLSRHDRRTGSGRGIERFEEGCSRPGLDKGVAQTVPYEVVNHRLLAEANFGLCGVDIDVNFFWRHLQEEQDDGRRGRRDDVAIGLGDGMHQEAIAYRVVC